MKQRIVLIGPPASGKGTQAALIKQRYGIPIASPGTILRKERQECTELGIEANSRTSQGLLLPDSAIIDLVSIWLQDPGDKFLLDGFPRTLGQAEALEILLREKASGLEVVIALEADDETLRSRVQNRLVCMVCGETLSLDLHVAESDDPCPKCGGDLGKRSDDTLDVLAARMAEYLEKTRPLFGFYTDRNLLRRIDSSRSPEVVFGEVTRIIEHG